MKLKCLKTGEILSVDHVVATDEHGNQWIYRDGIEAFVDPNTNTCPHAETQVAELSKSVASMAKAMSHVSNSLSAAIGRIDMQADQVNDARDDIRRLTDRLNAIEGLGIPR